MAYSLQKSGANYTVNINPDLVKSKGWSEGQKLDLKIVKKKIKVTPGTQVKLQHSNRGWFISVPIAENMDWSKGTMLQWKVDGNGDLILEEAE